MASFSLTNKAVEDLSNIWNYTFDTWSEQQADSYYAMLLDRCKELAARPGMGRPYDAVMSGVFGYRAGAHIIFYMVASAKEIEVVRILHSRMDLKNRLGD